MMYANNSVHLPPPYIDTSQRGVVAQRWILADEFPAEGTRVPLSRTVIYDNSSSSALASFKSAVSKPSVNQL